MRPLSIVLAAPRQSVNPYIRRLHEALSAQPSVETVTLGIESFWQPPSPVDIVHLHWPEALFAWEPIAETAFGRIERQLRAWRAHAAIVLTVHNRYPHVSNTPRFRDLYAAVIHGADGYIHLGHASQAELSESYPISRSRPSAVIPPGAVETSSRQAITPSEARRLLAIPNGAYAFLAFGYLRSAEETELLLRSFHRLRMADKYLLIAGPRVTFRRYLGTITRALLALHPRIHFHPRYVPDEMAPVYAQAANVVVIPRLQALNSSGIAFGFSFGKVVVGPDDGNVGEVLRATGNPTFEPGRIDSLVAAYQEARRLDASGKGAENKAYADAHWQLDSIGARHVAFYYEVIDAKGR